MVEERNQKKRGRKVQSTEGRERRKKGKIGITACVGLIFLGTLKQNLNILEHANKPHRTSVRKHLRTS